MFNICVYSKKARPTGRALRRFLGEEHFQVVFNIGNAANAEGFVVERRQFVLTAPIKELGLHEVRVHLHPEVDATIKLNVARSAEEAQLQASGKSIQELAAEEEAAAEFEIAELFDDIGSAGRDEDEGDN